jgi:hypothetical protein
MKALSLWQPWASLIAAGVKRHETRHWTTPYRGLLAIHAAKTLDLAGAPEILCGAVFGLNWARLPLGADAVRVQGDVTHADREAGNFAMGRFAWRIDNVRPLRTPIPAVGRQGLFNWTPPDNLEGLLGPVVDHSRACERIGMGARPRRVA